MAQNVKKVASKNLKKPKVAENSKSCQNSKKLPKISKVAEKLPSNLWLSLPLDVLISDKLLRALRSTRTTRDTANTRSEIVIMYKLLPLLEQKVQGVVLIPESIDIDLAITLYQEF